MRLQIAKLGMSKNIRKRDGARHFVTKITSPKASDITPLPLKKKLCGSRRFGKTVKKSLGGGGGRSPPRGGAPAYVIATLVFCLILCVHVFALSRIIVLPRLFIVKGLKLNRRRILQLTRLWLRSSKRKGRAETKESKRRYATVFFTRMRRNFGY